VSRIVHVVPAISEESSGPSYSVVRLCDSIISRGAGIVLISLQLSPIKTYPLYLKTFPIGFGPARLGASPTMFDWLRKEVAEENVSLIHNHGMWQINSLYPGWVCSKNNLQYIVSPRGALSKWSMESGSFFKKIFWPLLQKPSLEKATCFHATSMDEYEDIRRLGFCQPVAVIPNGVDIPAMPLKKDQEQFLTLLFLGRLHPKKGVDILLSAWGEVQDLFPHWQLIIAGDDNGYYGKSGYAEKLRLQIKSLGLERVNLIGAVHGEQKSKSYANANIFVLPTYSENFGLTVAESLSYGTPAIVSKGAPWEGLIQHEAGWWVDIGRDPLIACFKEAMAYDPDALSSMGMHGRDWMGKEFSWSEVAFKMNDTYKWLLDKSLPVPKWVLTN